MGRSAPQEPQKENTESKDINYNLENALCVVDNKDVRDVQTIGDSFVSVGCQHCCGVRKYVCSTETETWGK